MKKEKLKKEQKRCTIISDHTFTFLKKDKNSLFDTVFFKNINFDTNFNISLNCSSKY